MGEGVSKLERLDEAIERMESFTWAGCKDRPGLALRVITDAARAYRDLLANGQRVQPDYEAAAKARMDNGEMAMNHVSRTDLEAIVRAAIGDRLLSVYPKEAENE